MKRQSHIRDLAIMVIFPASGLFMFTENVRNVDILGLLASGAVFGIYLSRLLMNIRAQKKEG